MRAGYWSGRIIEDDFWCINDQVVPIGAINSGTAMHDRLTKMLRVENTRYAPGRNLQHDVKTVGQTHYALSQST